MKNLFFISQFFKLVILPFAIFFLGYNSSVIIKYNYDFLFHHSLIIFFLFFFFLINNLIFRKSKHIENIQIIIIALISCFVLGIILTNIQENLLYTRWLDLGLFPSNDAEDYVNQSAQYLTKNSFYTSKGRVIFPILYAGFLGEFEFNIKLIQLITTIISSLTTFYVSLIIFKKYGYVCSLIFCCLCTDFLIEHIGGVSTENIGYILGGIAFIFFIKLIEIREKKLINLSLFFLFILIAYLIRPSLPLLLVFISIWTFTYIKKISNNLFYKSITSLVIITCMVIFSNKTLIQYKSPKSSTEFGNIYDSWYATHELGEYYLNDKYDEIPGTLWTKILKDFPELNELQGRNFVNAKRQIIIETFKNDTKSYLIGSILQIKNFFNKSKSYIERFDHSSGFLFIEFYYYRVICLILFLLGGVMSLFYFIRYKETQNLLIFLIFSSVLLSQPFVFGGEARTVAATIFFMNLVVIFPIYTFIQKFFKKVNELAINNQNYLSINCISNFNLSIIIFLIIIFIKAINNNYSHIQTNNLRSNFYCESNKVYKEVFFNSQSGFYLNTHQKNIKENYKDFSDILDVYADLASILKSKNALEYTYTMTKEEIENRDKYKFFSRFNNTNNGRSLFNYEKEGVIFKSMVTQFLTDEAFYIKPIDLKNNNLHDIMILKVDLIKNGINKLAICM